MDRRGEKSGWKRSTRKEDKQKGEINIKRRIGYQSTDWDIKEDWDIKTRIGYQSMDWDIKEDKQRPRPKVLPLVQERTGYGGRGRVRTCVPTQPPEPPSPAAAIPHDWEGGGSFKEGAVW